MSVLMLSPFFFPEVISTGKYNRVLAQALVASEREVVVITSHPMYPEWHPRRSDEGLPGIVIKRGGLWMRYPRSATLRRALLELWFAAFCFMEYIRLRPKPRHIVAIFPPTIFMLLLKLVITRESVVTGIVHDLQFVHVARSTSLRSRLVNKFVCLMERQSFAACDRVVFLSQAMAESAIRQYGLDARRCSVCYPFPTTRLSEATTGALENILLPENINVVYSGALGEKQCPDKLVALMTKLAKRDGRIRCHIFSAGPHFERLKREYAEGSDSTVTFRGFVSDDQLPELYARSAVQLIPQATGTGEGSLPSKLPNLLFAGVPIFAICDADSEVSRFLEETKSGYSAVSFLESDVSAGFGTLLKEFAIESRAARMDRLRPFVDEIFNVEILVNLILKPTT